MPITAQVHQRNGLFETEKLSVLNKGNHLFQKDAVLILNFSYYHNYGILRYRN